MNRLPVCDKKITMILDFLKERKDNAYNRRQISEYLWANYSYCDYKTFDQLLGEVGEKLYIHVNNLDTELVQIVQYNTRPYTYQFVGALHNTKLENNQIAMVFEDEPNQPDIQEQVEEVSDVPPSVEPVLIEDSVIPPLEESVLIEDLRAADKIKFDSVLEDVEELLRSSTDKTKTIVQILQVIIRNS
jgi:hypothetical protein